jgi:osmotically-inducible protein OsmY
MRPEDTFTQKPLHATLVVVVALTIGGLGACQATTGKTPSESMHDASVTAAVQRTLTTERAANFTRVDVDTTQGVVRLRGVVQTPEQRARAEELTRRIDGVKRVHNDLQIQTAQP